MRRLMSVTAFALLFTVSLWAQRGGGQVGGGRAGFSGGVRSGGFVGRPAGGMGGARVSGGMHFGGGFSHGFNQGVHHGSSSNSFHNHHGSHGVHVHTFGFHNNCVGWNCGFASFPWWGWGYSDPWLRWEDQDRRFEEDYYRQYAIAAQMNRDSLEEQRLRRQAEADDDQDAYAPVQRRQAAPPERDPDPILPATVLVFRDQHQQEIQNYAIVGQTLWHFTPQRTVKIALANLDLPATQKANEDRGVTFQVPGHEGQ